MAQPSSTRTIVRFFEKKAVVLSHEPCLEFSRQCLEEVRTLTWPRDSKSSEFINYVQCRYLVDSLNKAIEKASSFLEHNRHDGGDSVSTEDVRESPLELLKILCMLAKKVKWFIECCCNGPWLQMAVLLSNSSHCTASLGFDLELFRVILPLYGTSRRYSSSPLTIGQISALRHEEGEHVKEMASNDEDSLVTKLRTLIDYGQASSDDLGLARFLLERRDEVEFKQRLFSVTSLFWPSILAKRDFTNMKDLVKIGSSGSGTVLKASWLGLHVAVKIFNRSVYFGWRRKVSLLRVFSSQHCIHFLVWRGPGRPVYCHGIDGSRSLLAAENETAERRNTEFSFLHLCRV